MAPKSGYYVQAKRDFTGICDKRRKMFSFC